MGFLALPKDAPGVVGGGGVVGVGMLGVALEGWEGICALCKVGHS